MNQTLEVLFDGLEGSCPIHEQCSPSCPLRLVTLSAVAVWLAHGDLRHSSHLETPVTIEPGVPRLKYAPLRHSAGEIRLLKIKPATLRADAIELELICESLDRLPIYGALSYCWGGGDTNHKIQCNLGYLEVSRNLQRALKRLRAGFRPEQREQWLWVDAICINQADLQEKGYQIPLMERIYSQATTVYVDLGDIRDRIEGPPPDVYFDWGIIDPGVARHPLKYVTALQALRQPYFTRRWIVQEFVLARAIKIIYMGHIFDAEDLEALAGPAALMRTSNLNITVLVNQNFTTAMGNYLNMLKIKKLRNNRLMKSLEIMGFLNNFACTEAKDKIFAALALASPEERSMMPHYSAPVWVIYQLYAAAQILRGNTFAVLSFAGLHRRNLASDLPTWVPDWSTDQRGPLPIEHPGHVLFAAATSRTATSVLLTNPDVSDSHPRKLQVRGVGVGTISGTIVWPDLLGSNLQDEATAMTDFYIRLRAAFDRALHAGGLRYTEAEDELARCLIMGNTHGFETMIQMASTALEPARACAEAFRRWEAGADYCDMAQRGEHWDAVATFQIAASGNITERAFTILHEGYFAIAPLVCREGDIVVAFYGSRCLHVLRRVEGGDETYQLVGDAYVQGLMNGEALRTEHTATDFVLV